jgi:hypothetical protein
MTSFLTHLLYTERLDDVWRQEVLQIDSYSSALADVWALVLTFFNALTGGRPWNLASEACSHYKFFVRLKHENYLAHQFPLSRDFHALFKDALVENPDQRLTLRGVRKRLEGPFVFYPTRIRSGAREVARLCDESASHWQYLQECASRKRSEDDAADAALAALIQDVLRGFEASRPEPLYDESVFLFPQCPPRLTCPQCLLLGVLCA